LLIFRGIERKLEERRLVFNGEMIRYEYIK
jgi:hypothetical protein